MKIIDAHAHICEYINGYGAKGELRALGDGMVQYASGDTFRIIPKGMGEYGTTPEKLLEVMDANNVEKAVLMQGMYLGFQNLYSYEATKKYPDRFVSAATLDIYTRNKDKIIKYLFDELNIKIIKMEMSTTSGLMANHETVDLDGKEMNELYQMAQDKQLVFVIDIGRPGSDSWQIDNLVKAIKKYPALTFVICHLCAFQVDQISLLEETLPKLNLPNVYFDLAAVPNNTKPESYPFSSALSYVKKAVSILGSQKLMWGSDMPAALNYDTYEHMVSYILESKQFTKQEIDNIFYHNANKIYFNGKTLK